MTTQPTEEQKKAMAKVFLDTVKKVFDKMMKFINLAVQFAGAWYRVEKICQFSSSTVVYSNAGVFDAGMVAKSKDIIDTAIALIPTEMKEKRFQMELFIKLLTLCRFRIITKNDIYKIFRFDKYGQCGVLWDLYQAICLAYELLGMASSHTANDGDLVIPAEPLDTLNEYREAMVIVQLSIAHHMIKAAVGDVRQHITMETYKIYTITQGFWWALVLRELVSDTRNTEPYFHTPVYLTDEEKAFSLSSASVVAPYIRSLGFFIDTKIDPYYKSAE